MPVEFDLKRFTSVSTLFCETGTFHGEGVLKALEAGFESGDVLCVYPGKLHDKLFGPY